MSTDEEKPMIYWIRHCATTGQEPEAPLTPGGFVQAQSLAAVLEPLAVSRVVSSPFLRAIQSISPFAAARSLRIEIDNRLRERVLSNGPLDDWQTTLRRTFDDADYAAPGGETSREAELRVFAALDDTLADGRTTAIVSHGNLTSLLLRRIGWPIDFEASLRLTNPDMFGIRNRGNSFEITRLWH